MFCEKCNQKVNVRTIRRVSDQIVCKQCILNNNNIDNIDKIDKIDKINPSFEEAKSECLAKIFVYTYSLLYKNKIIS